MKKDDLLQKGRRTGNALGGKIWKIMRLTGLFLLISFVAISAETYSQNTRFSFKMENRTLNDLFLYLEQNSGYRFAYNKSDLDDAQKISCEFKNESIDQILEKVLDTGKLSVLIKNEYIIITSKENTTGNLLPVSQPVKTVSGKVTDSSGTSLPGVSVIVKGTTIGVITDFNGTYSLSNIPGNALLQFSFVGMKAQEIIVGSKTSINVTLEEETIGIEEVVAIGYGSVKAKELTSSVSHVSSKDFIKIGSTNPLMQIQGKVASVSIQNQAAADPNSNPNMQIRGISSRNAGLGPLYVVDGVTDVNMQNVNANDIESIDVLKDGAASAIYGTRGSNGVIVVTTKKGNHDGKVHTIYNGYMSMDKIYDAPHVLTADEFRKYRVPGGAVDFGGSSDWFKAITQVAKTQSHALTISSGTQKFNYRATLDVRDATGIDIRSDRKEYGARVTLNQGTADDILRFSVNVAPRVIKRNMADQNAIDLSMRFNPTFPIMDPGNPLLYNDFNGKLPTGPNPVETLNLVKNGSETKLFDWNATAGLNILTLLNPKFAGADNTLGTQITLSQNITDNFDYNFNPSTTTNNRFQGIKGIAGRAYSKEVNQSLEWLLNGSYKYKQHTFTGMAGYSYSYFVNSGFSARNRNFASDALEYNSLGGGDNEAKLDPTRVGMSSNKSDSKLIGFFSRVSYNYKMRYMLTGSLRYEGSSRFGENNKWGFFPAISSGWRISEEAFMQNISWVDDLKLRADFGITGNQNIPNYKSLSLYSTYGDQYYYGNYVKTAGPSTNVNSDLRWEKGVNWNIGADFTVLKGTLTGSINYYNRTQKDLVGDYSAPVPPNLVSTIYANVGTMKNSGLELEMQIIAVRGKNFKYNINLVGETIDNKFVSFSNDVYRGNNFQDIAVLVLGDFGTSNSSVQRLEEGKRVGSFYTYAYAGLDDKGNWLFWNADNTKAIPIAESKETDRRYTGNGLPKYRASMTHNFTYKNFDLTVSFRGAFGFDIFNVHEAAFGLKNAQPGYNTYLSAYTTNVAINAPIGKLSNYFMEKGDYLKLDVATLGYTLNLKDLRMLSGIRLYLTGRNLLTFKSAHNGLDPDYYPANGLTPGVSTTTNFYPSTRQFLIGAQINF